MFNWASLDIIYYPVSGIMWLWYKLFALVLGPTNFFAWALSVVFLVFSLRALLYKPFVRQIRTTRQMQELQPQIKALQKKYGKDRQRMALEMQKLQKEHGFNPILGCLPMLAQIPVFIGLFHVLRSFNRTGGFGIGAQHLPVDVNRSLPNYFFSAEDVGHFLDANLFGAPLGAWMTQSTGLEAFTQFGHFSRPALIAVGVPVMIAAGIATYFNSRASISRQSPEAAANPQTAIMNKLALYVFPLGVVVGGPFLPLAIILYWFANNVWTFGQQHYVFGKIEQEEEAKKQEALERRSANAPAPGAKPAKRKKSATGTAANAATTVTEDGAEAEAPAEAEGEGATETTPQKPAAQKPAAKATPKTAAKGGQAKAGGTANRNPRPGAKPKKRKR
ncbi:membrane protein insertase YidC [Mycolicibacterium chitae]|uniref:Membrane protein insertase YidC n=1 Tax=Mycolicibacterium chitae TaxID=1792 RepID=A0A3S4VGF3_MYCCI|nr:membrane protein insertase YidC [Mycolicibacterium chitae]MCV7107418.1 membrane protein insertase YidC [Mycolicibacterium chitae]BBZ02079.1 membrane protein insertase YidC [Mycolicibacterium chitae]VEG50895.1 putative inner membrane protein translocase component YidC [Mycolicibacterium chitae]